MHTLPTGPASPASQLAHEAANATQDSEGLDEIAQDLTHIVAKLMMEAGATPSRNQRRTLRRYWKLSVDRLRLTRDASGIGTVR